MFEKFLEKNKFLIYITILILTTLGQDHVFCIIRLYKLQILTDIHMKVGCRIQTEH